MATLAETLTTRVERSPLNKAYLVIIVALATLSFAAVLMRLALNAGMESPAVAGLRLLTASAILTPLVLRRYWGQLALLNRRDVLLSALAGVWLGVHFVFIATAFDLTSILIAQVIVNTGPLWVALLELVFLKVRLSRTVWLGLFIAIGGGILIGAGGAFAPDGGVVRTAMLSVLPSQAGAAGESNFMLGVVFAIIGAVAGAIYITVGRKARAKVSLIPYVWMVYAFGAATVLLIMLVIGTPLLGYAPMAYFWILLLALVPQLVGHSGLNYALGYLSATVVSISTQIITVTAAVIAFFLFAEVPTLLDILASAIIIAGVSLVILGQKR